MTLVDKAAPIRTGEELDTTALAACLAVHFGGGEEGLAPRQAQAEGRSVGAGGVHLD